VIQAGIMLLIALLILGKFGKPIMAAIVFALAAFVLVTGIFFPRAFLAVDGAMRAFGRGVGTGLTWILLVPFFFLCFAPARVILRLRGSDPMKRAFPSPEKTHWAPHQSRRDMNHYKKQF
jgi:hypothetical protein